MAPLLPVNKSLSQIDTRRLRVLLKQEKGTAGVSIDVKVGPNEFKLGQNFDIVKERKHMKSSASGSNSFVRVQMKTAYGKRQHY